MSHFSLYLSITLLFVGILTAKSVTTIEFDATSGYHFTVNGLNYEVKGVAGDKNFELLKDFGGNTVRTWAINNEILDKAHQSGLKVVAGI